MLEFNDQTAPHQIAFEAYGVQARVVASSAELLARMEPFMPPGWRPCAPADTLHPLGIIVELDGTYSVYNGATRVSEGQGLELSIMLLDGQVRGYVALRAPDKTFVHASVAARDGRALVFPGHSFAGKTTLVAALVRAGATYYSDEFAVFDEDGLVHPYAKPLSLRPGSGGQVEVPVEELGGVAGYEPLALGLVAFTYYVPGAGWQPEQLSTGAGALNLLSFAVTVRSRPAAAMRAITRALDGAIALSGERGEADEVAELLLSRSALAEPTSST